MGVSHYYCGKCDECLYEDCFSCCDRCDEHFESNCCGYVCDDCLKDKVDYYSLEGEDDTKYCPSCTIKELSEKLRKK